MAQQAAAETRCKNGDTNYPILYEDYNLRVYKNPSNEIFVEDIESGAVMRIFSYLSRGNGTQGLSFTTSERVEPVQIDNMIGWLLTRR